MTCRAKVSGAKVSGVTRGLLAAVILFSVGLAAQSGGYERAFPQSKATIEKILKEMQATTAGRLPVVDGFATSPAADHPIERYQRGYYQSKFQVFAAPSGGSIVRVSVQVTAWYADPLPAKIGVPVAPIEWAAGRRSAGSTGRPGRGHRASYESGFAGHGTGEAAEGLGIGDLGIERADDLGADAQTSADQGWLFVVVSAESAGGRKRAAQPPPRKKLKIKRAVRCKPNSTVWKKFSRISLIPRTWSP
jgi:hypothetical protein